MLFVAAPGLCTCLLVLVPCSWSLHPVFAPGCLYLFLAHGLCTRSLHLGACTCSLHTVSAPGLCTCVVAPVSLYLVSVLEHGLSRACAAVVTSASSAQSVRRSRKQCASSAQAVRRSRDQRSLARTCMPGISYNEGICKHCQAVQWLPGRHQQQAHRLRRFFSALAAVQAGQWLPGRHQQRAHRPGAAGARRAVPWNLLFRNLLPPRRRAAEPARPRRARGV